MIWWITDSSSHVSQCLFYVMKCWDQMNHWLGTIPKLEMRSFFVHISIRLNILFCKYVQCTVYTYKYFRKKPKVWIDSTFSFHFFNQPTVSIHDPQLNSSGTDVSWTDFRYRCSRTHFVFPQKKTADNSFVFLYNTRDTTHVYRFHFNIHTVLPFPLVSSFAI